VANKTLTELIADVRSHLDETTAAQWSDAEITRWLNEGQQDIARRAEVLQTTQSVAGVIDTQQYSFTDPNIVRIYRVEWRPDAGGVYPLEYRDFHNMDSVWWSQQITGSGRPALFTLWGYPPNLQLTVYPKPGEDGDFKVFYYKMPTAMSVGADTADVPNGWEDLLVLYCETVCLRKDADPRWQEAKAIYEERLGAMIDVTRRWTDQAGMVDTYSGAMIPAWLYSEW
jgi:hypothetical protein